MFLWLRLIIFYNLIIRRPCSAYYEGETNLRMGGKLKKLATELTLDAYSKIASIQHLRSELHKDIPFQYGNILYEMSFRHKKMFNIYTQVLRAMDEGKGDDQLYINAIAEVDTLAHEISNFVTMIQIHHANIHLDKTKPGYDLFFRRSDTMVPAWLDLLDSFDNDAPETSTPPPEDNNQTESVKRKNGEWHYTAPTN